MKVTKAYDLDELVAGLADKGLTNIENAGSDLYMGFKDWVVQSAKLSASPYDDLGLPFVSYIDSLVLPQIDKINGKIG